MRHAPLQHPRRSAQGARPALVIAVAIAVTITTALAVLAQPTSATARRHLVQTSNPPRFGELCFTSVRDNRYWDISLMDIASGAVRRITRQTSNTMASSWTRDGTRLAVLTDRDGNLEIYTMAADGSDLRRITRTSGNDYGPVWSPDGQHLAYAEDVGANTQQLFVCSPDGSNRVQLTSGAPGAYGPIWSPDGARLSYISGRSVMAMNADGSNRVVLTSVNADLQNSDWSPDGSRVMFMSRQSGVFKLYTIRLADGTVEAIPTGDYDAWDGCWSPDGSLIAFYSYGIQSSGFPGMFAVFLMNADGSNRRKITTLLQTDRSWHPVWRP
jgi:Tol biopolymer transport system component